MLLGRDIRVDRSQCENFSICGKSGHVRSSRGWTRCNCLLREIHQRYLGMMYTDNVVAQTKLSSLSGKTIRLEGSLEGVRRHVARVLLDKRGKMTWLAMDAYRLIDIFLGEDKEYQTQVHATSVDLLLLLVGFADPPNRYLPELICQVLARRELEHRATWVILGMDPMRLSLKYNEQMATTVQSLKQVLVR